MKKLLVLGGTINQVPLIQAAKREGYYVIVCDWTTDNPGIQFADKHYQVSTLDRPAVLHVAENEAIDGVISNSETAMVNVAYISEKLGLIGNPEEGIQILSSKDKFRNFQEELGLFAPRHHVTDSKEEYMQIVDQIGFPLIVKPVECTGTRGTTKLSEYNAELLNAAFDECIYYSANRKLSVEEYVEMPSLTVIDGDVFLVDGKIIWNGMFSSSRSVIAPMVPMTQSFPLRMEEKRMREIKKTITLIFEKLGIVFGEYNVEMYFTTNDKLFVIEINARQGGNGIPKMIQAHCGIDMYKLLVTTSVGDYDYYHEIIKAPYTCNYVSRMPVFSKQNGIYKGLHIDTAVEKYVVEINESKQLGEPVERIKNAKSVVAFVSMRFDSYEQQHAIVDRLEDLIYPEV